MWQSVWEFYSGSGTKVMITPAQLRRMRKNMKKVPKIQDKAQQYSQKEWEYVDQRFDNILETL